MEIKSQAYNRNVAIYGFAVLVVAVLLTLPWLGLGHFYTRGEPREALVAVAMMEQGNYILPVFQGEIAFKPPMLHWLVSLFSLPQGYVSEYTARMPSAIASIVMVFAFFVFYSRRVGYGKSLVASLLLITCFEVHRAAMTCRVDMVLMAFTVGSMMALSRWLENGCRKLPSGIDKGTCRGDIAVLCIGYLYGCPQGAVECHCDCRVEVCCVVCHSAVVLVCRGVYAGRRQVFAIGYGRKFRAFSW